jgi:excisionase family DNA binding protein
MPEHSQPEFLSITQAAARLGVVYNTVRNAILAGDLVAFKFRGTYRIRSEDFDSVVQACRYEPRGRATPAPTPKVAASTLKHLDGARLRESWRTQGVFDPAATAPTKKRA